MKQLVVVGGCVLVARALRRRRVSRQSPAVVWRMAHRVSHGVSAASLQSAEDWRRWELELGGLRWPEDVLPSS